MESLDIGDRFTRPHLDTSALIVIDTQVDFLDGGASPIEGTSERLPQMTALVEAFRTARLPIVHVVRLYQGDDTDLVRREALTSGFNVVRPDTDGAQIPSALLRGSDVRLDSNTLLAGKLQEVGNNEVILWKPRWSAFYRTALEEHLKSHGVDTVVIAGCNFPNCPRATIFDASERDFRILIAEDAVSGVTKDGLDDARKIGAYAMPIATLIHAIPSAS